MFLYTTLNSKAEIKDFVLSDPFPSDWIKAKDIERRYKSIWEEHCLECAAPACYGNCLCYIKREDGKCQKTFYGIKNRKDLNNNTVCASQLKFRKWGKIETVLFPSSLPAVSYRKLERRCARIESLLSLFSGTFHWRLLTKFKDGLIKYCSRTRESQPRSFILQCFSPALLDFSLFIEIFGHNRHSILRQAFHVKRGYNQFILSLSDTILNLEEKMWVRIFPENNLEAELIFFLCDFVDLKPAVPVLEPTPIIKCVAWDLDHTIWDGTLIESNPEGLALRDGVKQAIINLDARGFLQVVVSKNYEKDVIPVLQRLGIYEYFVYVCANWQPKSQNLSTLAQLLNISVDSFALIDDSAFERGEVTKNLGGVRVYDEQVIPHLLALPEFDVPVTADAVRRREMYQQEIRRRVIEKDFSSNLSFLKDCKIEIVVEHIGASSFERSYELLQRTNQLNLSGRRYQREVFQELCDKEFDNIFVLHCSDKYGDYGQIGCFWLHLREKTLSIDEFVLSCRVAGKMIEPAVLSWLMDRYDADTLVLNGVDNHRNRLLIETLKGLGFTNEAADGLLALTITRERANWENVVSVLDRTSSPI